MKFNQRDPYTGKVLSDKVDAEVAVVTAVERGVDDCEGQLERMQGKLYELTAIVGRLLARDNSGEGLAEVIGPGWEVAEKD